MEKKEANIKVEIFSKDYFYIKDSNDVIYNINTNDIDNKQKLLNYILTILQDKTQNPVQNGGNINKIIKIIDDDDLKQLRFKQYR